MNKRQIKRIITFSVVPIIVALSFYTNDILLRVILILVLFVYVGFIIFMRDSFRMDRGYGYNESEEIELSDLPSQDVDDEFKIISPIKNIETVGSTTPRTTFPRREILKPIEFKEKYEEIANEPLDPDLDSSGKFSFALEKILTAIQEAYNAHSVVFFWYNDKSEKISVHKFVSKSNDISDKTKLDLEDDILSKIVQTSEPQLLSDITPNAENDNIRYYKSLQGIKSFVGVPIYYEGNLIALMALDSKGPDAFGIETIYSLGRFTRVITLMIQVFKERHKEQVSQRRLNALLNFLNEDLEYDSYDNFLSSFATKFDELIEWDVFSIVYYDAISKEFNVKKVANKTSLKYVGEGLEVELNGTLVGKSITTNSPIKVDEIGLEKIFRYNKSEDLTGFGSCMIIPINFRDKTFGAFCFESLKSNHFTNSDIKFIESISTFIAYILDNVFSKKMMEKLISLDIETLILNENAFKQRLQEELFKANSVGAKGVLALIKIDDFLEQSSLFETDPFHKILKEILTITKKEIPEYVIFGRISERLFAAHFFNYEMKNVFVWAEKLRVKIARHPIYVDMKQNTYTVSIGLCTTTGKTNVEEVIENAHLALYKAVEKGGNTVLHNN